MSASKKIKERYEEKRNLAWPGLIGVSETNRVLWEQSVKKGFVNIPRAMPYILNILDYLSKNSGGTPVSSTYLSLWCRDFGTGFIEIKDIDELAVEAGFSGSRAVTTLSTRIKTLSSEDNKGLGFIRTSKSGTGKYKSILLLNPFLIIRLKFNDGTLPKELYDTIYSRCIDVGDLNLSSFDTSFEDIKHKQKYFEWAKGKLIELRNT
jgi:hypothetical protein